MDLLDIYSDYLIVQSQRATATGLSDLLGGSVSHDKITRFLNQNDFRDEMGNIETLANATQYGKRTVFIKRINLYGHKMFAHVILDPYKKAKDTTKLVCESFEEEEAEEVTNYEMKADTSC